MCTRNCIFHIMFLVIQLSFGTAFWWMATSAVHWIWSVIWIWTQIHLQSTRTGIHHPVCIESFCTLLLISLVITLNNKAILVYLLISLGHQLTNCSFSYLFIENLLNQVGLGNLKRSWYPNDKVIRLTFPSSLKADIPWRQL